MTVSLTTIFIWFAFPLTAEVFFAYWFQEGMGWDRAEAFEKVLLTGIFLGITFPALILPTMGFVSLGANLFNSLYY